MIKKLLNLLFVGALPLAASAIIAYPGPIEVTQPDGSVLKVIQKGDEKHHITTTEDGLIIRMDKDGYYRYASVDSEGRLKADGPIVRSITERTASELSYIASVDTEAMLNRASEERLARISQKTLPRVERQRMMSPASAPEKGLGLVDKAFPSYGEPRAAVILVEYQDVHFGVDNANDYYTRMLNQENFSDNGSTGSARDYFIFNSNGLFKPQFDVYGPVRLKGERKVYGGNNSWDDDQYAEGMVIEACQELDSKVDFSVYDHDGDGYIDNIFVFYAGGGEHDGGGGKDAVWPHAANLTDWVETPYIFDNVRLDSYGCTCELPKGYSRPDGIGTFVHEFSHVLGLPDLYPTGYTNAYTPGTYSCLDKGPYNNEGRTPPNYSSFERTALGWMKATRFGAEGVYELPELTESNKAYIVYSDSSSEYYLFENRQQSGNDEFIPGHGMLIWHIDYDKKAWENNVVNNTAIHQRVDLVEADNSKGSDRTGHPFPGAQNVTAFGYNTKPAMKFFFPTTHEIEFTDIQENNGLISFLYTNPNADTAVSEIEDSLGADIVETAGLTVIANEPCNVFSLSGVMIGQLAKGGSLTVPSHGLYIVTSESGSLKIAL